MSDAFILSRIADEDKGARYEELRQDLPLRAAVACLLLPLVGAGYRSSPAKKIPRQKARYFF